MPKMTKEDLKNMKPQRPAELDRLNMFVGKWESTGDMKMGRMDEPIKGKGANEGTWECEKMVVTIKETWEMEDVGTYNGTGLWMWDAKAKKYRSTWADNHGSIASGVATYNEDTKTWKMKTHGRGPMGSSKGKGTMTLVDDKTMNWTFTEWAMLGPIPIGKMFEGNGTSKKK